MVTNIGKNVNENLSGKHSASMLAIRQKLLDHAKQSATDALENASKRASKKTEEATGDLICNKISGEVLSKTLAMQFKSYDGKITKFSRTLQHNNSERVQNL